MASDEDISSLMKRGNYKLCLQKVAQLKKQLPNSSYYKVLEIYIRYRMSPAKFKCDESLGSYYGVNGSEVTSDTRALSLLHKLFTELGMHNEALMVYERANFKYQGLEVASQWFEKALEDCDYKQMVKASQQLAKLGGDLMEGLSHRDYVFWYALSIVSLFRFQRSRVSDQESKLLPQLAYRSLCNVKPFQSAEELYVFCTVCEDLFPEDEQKAQEIVQLVIPQLEGSVNLYMKNFLLRNLKHDDHSTAFEMTGKLLQRLNDFELITRYIHAAKNLGTPKDEVLERIEVYVGDSRNSRLAHLEADKAYDNQISLAALNHYLQKFHNKPCCAIDLDGYKESLNKDILRNAFSDYESKDLLHETNIFKLGLSEKTPVQAYVEHQSSLVGKSVTDYSTCSFFILKIVKDLVATEDEPSLENVLLALSLLENYQLKDQHNYETSVWIVALYMYLGCVPHAFSRYLELKTKNVQVDTADFIIFSRFSTMFPLKPHDYIRRAQENVNGFYRSSAGRLPQLIQISFERKSYSKILGILDFRSRIDSSSMKWLMASESVKMARLCNDKRSELLQTMHGDWRQLEKQGNIKLSDNRDFGIFGSDIQKDKLPYVLQYLDVDNDCIMLDCLTEFMIELIPTRERDARLEQHLKDLGASRGSRTETVDRINMSCFAQFEDLYSNDGAHLLEDMKDLSQLGQANSTWRLSHEYLIRMQLFKTLDSFKRIKDNSVKKSIKDSIKELRESCDELFSQYITRITEACEGLKTGQSALLLESLGYAPLDAGNISNGLLTVQKAIRNL